MNLDRSVLLLLPGCLCSHLYNLFFTCHKTSPLPTGMWGVPLKSDSRPAMGRALRDVRLSPLSWADGSTQAVNRLRRAANEFLPPPSQLSRAGFPKMSLHGDLHSLAQQKGLRSGPRRVKKKKKKNELTNVGQDMRCCCFFSFDSGNSSFRMTVWDSGNHQSLKCMWRMTICSWIPLASKAPEQIISKCVGWGEDLVSIINLLEAICVQL